MAAQGGHHGGHQAPHVDLQEGAVVSGKFENGNNFKGYKTSNLRGIRPSYCVGGSKQSLIYDFV